MAKTYGQTLQAPLITAGVPSAQQINLPNSWDVRKLLLKISMTCYEGAGGAVPVAWLDYVVNLMLAIDTIRFNLSGDFNGNWGGVSFDVSGQVLAYMALLQGFGPETIGANVGLVGAKSTQVFKLIAY